MTQEYPQGQGRPQGGDAPQQGPGDNPWHVNPWSSPAGSDAQQPTAPQAPVPAAAAHGGQGSPWHPQHGQQPWTEGQQWQHGAASYPAAAPAGQQAGGDPQHTRRGRPGWTSLAVVGLVAALVGGGGAIGIGTLVDDDSVATATLAPSSASSGSTSSQPPVVQDSATGVDWNKVATAVAPSTVTIEVQSSTAAGEGSGVILDTAGHILTNYHVVNGAGADAERRVILADGRVFDVTVVGEDAATDLAVLQITDAPSDLQPATLGDSSAVVVGQPVMAVGNPLGLTDTVTTGIVSALNRPVTTQQEQQEQQESPFPGFNQQQEPAQSEQVVTNAIQTDAAINPGNSGGALVDAGGAVIGINSSIASTGSQAGSIGLGFAIPIDEAKRIADELIQDGEAEHPVLGVTLSDATAEIDGVTRLGAGIQDVTGSSPAAEAGLKAGDVVTEVNGTPVSGAESLTALIRQQAPGSTVEVTVERDGKAQTVSATLASREGS